MGSLKLRWAAEDLDWLGAQLEKPSEAAKQERYPFLNLTENKAVFIKILSDIGRDVDVKFTKGKRKGKATMKFLTVQVLAEADVKTDQWVRVKEPQTYTLSMNPNKYDAIFKKHEPLTNKAGTLVDTGLVDTKEGTQFRKIVFKLATWVQPS